MPNVGGPREAQRRLLTSVSNLILLYGVECIRSLRIASAYRTVSSAAVMVIARTIPVALLALERRRKFRGSGDESDGDRLAKMLTTWQQEWDQASVGRWTHRLILNL
ncbi:uncharacterized protein LOC106640444 [Copidosoma floridanum]|uniref:uncharacterized protein LOC106640444 n=1 Tax=Copidosoma floridanum TaxID=29053 RepID=UPI0006C97764|nr:uncharacterized protein LOC106640444 [Copidosoma floridanum]